MNMKTPTKITLDEYEQELEDNFENATPLPAAEKAQTMALLKRGAKNYLKKGKRITIRVYDSDLECIKRIAMEEGLPYQTYITSVLHKISTGRLVDTRK